MLNFRCLWGKYYTFNLNLLNCTCQKGKMLVSSSSQRVWAILNIVPCYASVLYYDVILHLAALCEHCTEYFTGLLHVGVGEWSSQGHCLFVYFFTETFLQGSNLALPMSAPAEFRGHLGFASLAQPPPVPSQPNCNNKANYQTSGTRHSADILVSLRYTLLLDSSV